MNIIEIEKLAAEHYSQALKAHESGNREEAFRFYESALMLINKIGNKANDSVNCLYIKASGYGAIGNHIEAIKCYHKLLDIYKLSNSINGMAISLYHISMIYLYTNNTLEANNYLEKLYEISNNCDEDIIEGLNHAGYCYIHYFDDIDKASKFFKLAWKKSIEFKIISYQNEFINEFRRIFQDAREKGDKQPIYRILYIIHDINEIYYSRKNINSSIESLGFDCFQELGSLVRLNEFPNFDFIRRINQNLIQMNPWMKNIGSIPPLKER